MLRTALITPFIDHIAKNIDAHRAIQTNVPNTKPGFKSAVVNATYATNVHKHATINRAKNDVNFFIILPLCLILQIRNCPETSPLGVFCYTVYINFFIKIA